MSDTFTDVNTKVKLSEMTEVQATGETVVAGLQNGNNIITTVSSIGEIATAEAVKVIQPLLAGKLGKNDDIPITQVTGLQDTLNGKLGKTDSIPVSQVTGLQSALDDKMGKNDLIQISQVQGLQPVLDNKLGKNDKIETSQINNLSGFVDDAIANTPNIVNTVVQGDTDW